MAKRWRIHPHEPDRIAALQHAAKVPGVVAQILLCRGICEPKLVRQFLESKLTDLRDPGLLPGCTQAADRVAGAIRAGEPIVVYGDYDVDGITGTAILSQCLKLLGGKVRYYLPHRLDEGYGLNQEAVRRLAAEGTKLLVTVDCGICSVDEARIAAECGVDMIVTDHHEPGPAYPQAVAIVHPRLRGQGYPFGGLSGSGVALKLAWAICQQANGAKRVSPAMRNFLLQAVGLAALGTVADVVPLVDENRVLVRHGLQTLKQMPTPGLVALMKIAKLDEKPHLDAEDVAFMLGPRLNAAGRLGQAQLGVELLVTDRADRATELAQYIDGLNASRQTLERSIYLAAVKMAKEQFDPEQDAALVLANHGWHPGVLGIVAGRLAEKFHRPAILISWDAIGVKPGVGSARSIPGFHLYDALAACGEHLLGFGGHVAAAGLTIEPSKLDAFRADFCEYAAGAISEEQRVAELTIDAEAPLSVFTLEVVNQLEQLGPFGEGNNRPLLCTSGVTLAKPPQAMGSGGRHLSLHLAQHNITLRAVAFGAGDHLEELTKVEGPLDVAFRPVINTFRGRRTVELHLVDWRPGSR